MTRAALRLAFAMILATSAALAEEIGDAERGAKLFSQQCKACHQIGDGAVNRVGPHLNGVFGRKAGAIDGFNCSSPGNAVNTNPLFRLPFGQIFVRAVSSSSIGCLKGVVDNYIAVNKDRVGLNDGNRIATDPDAPATPTEIPADTPAETPPGPPPETPQEAPAEAPDSPPAEVPQESPAPDEAQAGPVPAKAAEEMEVFFTFRRAPRQGPGLAGLSMA